MERIKTLQSRLPRELRGSLNLIYMNALAELHNYGSRLKCDYRSMTPQERTAFVRSVGKTAVQNRRLIRVENQLGASARITGAGVLPHMIALELIDWIESLQETVIQKKIPILLEQDRESEQFSQLIRDISFFYPNILLQSEQLQQNSKERRKQPEDSKE